MRFTSFYKKKRVELGEKLGSGGEGDVFRVKGNDAVVVKLYNDHCRTDSRFEKLKRIIEKNMHYKETIGKKIAMPLDILLDSSGLFAGYVMPKINGKLIKTTLFSKKKIDVNYPNLTRRDLIELCIHFLEQIKYLHGKNILVGDINPQNILIDENNPKVCWIIDTDSFQVDEFPCPVGTDIFAPPRLQGVNFKDVLRTKEDEYFSMAIMLFMILMTGKHPYSQIGGESPASNIRTGNFPYKMNGKMENVPVGYFQYIWSHFTIKTKQAFIDVFANKKVINPDKWRNIFRGYIFAIDNGYTTNLVYPLSFRPYGKDIISVVCEECGKSFEITASWDEKLKELGKSPICGFCMQKVQASILAKKRDAYGKSALSKTSSASYKNATTKKRRKINKIQKYTNIPQNRQGSVNHYRVRKKRGIIVKIFRFIYRLFK